MKSLSLGKLVFFLVVLFSLCLPSAGLRRYLLSQHRARPLVSASFPIPVITSSSVPQLQPVTNALAFSVAAKLVSFLPPVAKDFIMGMCPADFLLILFVQFSHKRIFQFAHHVQSFLWNKFSMGKPYEYKKSILGFTQERTGLLVRFMTFAYGFKLLCIGLVKLGFQIRSDLPQLASSIMYTFYIAKFVDRFKSQFLKTFFPSIAESKRQSYVFNRSSSVVIWIAAGLIICEMVSAFLKVPLSSTLAFGGVGGLAIGLSARDLAANFLGGMLLLFNEPFTPGDMVTFRTGSVEFLGRVERVGWGQTRIRGKDTRPTYIPNSHFVGCAVTNMERITHRKFESTVRLRLQVKPS
eukprot:gene3358-3681_t